MGKTSQCRDINKLNVLVKVMLEAALNEIKAQGVNPLVVETLRTKERQYMLYGQGRTQAQCRAAGVPTMYASPSSNKVTWTTDSIHLTGCAVDVVPQRKVNGTMQAIWNTKDKDTQKIIKTMQEYGFEAGANWKTSPDSPHFQVKGIAAKSKTFNKKCTNVFITKMLQKKLNEVIKSKLAIDGVWGKNTDKAVNEFRRMHGWKETEALGEKALKTLLVS